ncbi:MAG: sugar nucleotide-binding protein, partial [Gammaproteobacteria bacterium]|nr:sugar nucleotide-binding protein [Gammaproteobacteria bacterium]
CLFLSATSVYAQNRGEWLDEESPTSPGTYNGMSLLSAEEAVLGWSPNPLVVRFAGIYGPDRMRLVRQLEKPLTIQRTPAAYTNRVHQEDCVGSLRFLAGLQPGGRNSHRS